jgi:hypothetical protein
LYEQSNAEEIAGWIVDDCQQKCHDNGTESTSIVSRLLAICEDGGKADEDRAVKLDASTYTRQYE